MLIEKDAIVFCVWVWIFMGSYEGSSINEDVHGQLSWLWRKCTSTCDRQSMLTCRERIGIGQPFAFLEPKVIPHSILKIDQPCLEPTVPFITLEDGVIESLSNAICKLPSSPNQE